MAMRQTRWFATLGVSGACVIACGGLVHVPDLPGDAGAGYSSSGVTLGTLSSSSTSDIQSCSTTSDTQSSSTTSDVQSSSTTSESSSASTTQSGTIGACEPPPGGPPCTPGFVSCVGDAGPSCPLATSACCEVMGDPNACQPKGKECAGMTVTCNEAADCAGGQVCCLSSTSITGGTTSCQTLVSGKCPYAPIATAQICRSDTECANGTCSLWSCLGGTLIIESCAEPTPGDPSLCVKM